MDINKLKIILRKFPEKAVILWEYGPKYGKKINEFHEPKTEKGKRKIPMTLKAYQILKRQKLWKAEIEAKGKKAPEGFEDLVFVTTRNAPISQNDTELVMKVISDRIAKEHEKFKPLTPHTLRHTFATRCIERGMNSKTVQVILGHSSVNITVISKNQFNKVLFFKENFHN